MRYLHVSSLNFGSRHLLGGLLVIAAAIPLLTVAGAATAAAAAAPDTWDKVAACESSGNWAIDSGNGFYGGLQFTAATWAAFGGHAYAPNAHEASKEAQISVAEKVLEEQGPGAWPHCSVSAGLTRNSQSPTPAVPAPATPPDTDPSDSPACEADGSFTVGKGDIPNSLASGPCVGREELRDENKNENAIANGTDPDENLQPGLILNPGCDRQRLDRYAAPDPQPETQSQTQQDTTPDIPGATTQMAAVQPATGPGALPVSGAVVTTPYRQPGAWAAGFHTGIDLAVPTGTPVVAAAAGTVVTADWQGSYGNAVIIQHADGRYTLYAHLSTITVKQGDQVAAAQEIGLSGSTGNSTGPHLHFEARTSNNYDAHTDPVAFLRELGVSL
ncbi:peptidoglycan DD-metalloendopeptidase family protein [Streptomyces sp. Isolate_45]|uniref:peptidoglycan DD-metalloendopeptidase family protein n=1 Tax=Streptomyces sp. Isolate_45 TaxID=2950111 RepID=UPI0024819E94|nr:peptidoglycan DD-metalloendopeptidase family protein [Streptomyces sp. Isolate_45]MDA5283709.1 peptidoglycan DD-metalloendopeptidase family protein [Streptomyces sp. Isolate_45]